jgi:hypothetical protein
MWKCAVQGANDAVSAQGFGRTGWYAGTGIDPVGWSWGSWRNGGQRKLLPQAAPPCTLHPLNRPKGINGYDLQIGEPALIDGLCYYFNATVQPQHVPRLALSELDIELDYPAGKRKASFLCGGQFLRVRDNNDTDTESIYCYSGHAAAQRRARDGLADLVSRLIWRKEELDVRRLGATAAGAVLSGSGVSLARSRSGTADPPERPSQGDSSFRLDDGPEQRRANGAAPSLTK